MATGSRFRRTALVALSIVTVFVAGASASIDLPTIYRVEGYLDRAPAGATIEARVGIDKVGMRKRELLVTSYRAESGGAGERTPPRRYYLQGPARDLARLRDAPVGSRVKGRFAVYWRTAPSVVIASLEEPS